MKASELRSKDQAELKTELNDLLKAQFEESEKGYCSGKDCHEF